MSNGTVEENEGGDFIPMVVTHFKGKPFRPHLAAWLLVGITVGLMMSPSVSVNSLIAFSLAGCISCTVLALLTYPLSTNHVLVVIGATIGGVTAWAYGQIWQLESVSSVVQTCLMVGALLGASSLVWQSPLLIWKFIKTQMSNG